MKEDGYQSNLYINLKQLLLFYSFMTSFAGDIL